MYVNGAGDSKKFSLNSALMLCGYEGLSINNHNYWSSNQDITAKNKANSLLFSVGNPQAPTKKNNKDVCCIREFN